MSDAEQMNRIIGCWALAEKRAKHLCAFETLDLSFRLKKPTREGVKKAWYRLAMRLHPDKNSDSALATEATRCINLAKQYLFEEHFGDAASRVMHKHTWREAAAEKAAAEKAAAEKESADKPAATEETTAPLAVEPTQVAAQPTEQHAAETVAQQLAELPARAAAEQASPQRTGPSEQTSKRPRSESPAPDGERPASAQQHEEEVKRQQCSASSAACSAEVCS